MTKGVRDRLKMVTCPCIDLTAQLVELVKPLVSAGRRVIVNDDQHVDIAGRTRIVARNRPEHRHRHRSGEHLTTRRCQTPEKLLAGICGKKHRRGKDVVTVQPIDKPVVGGLCDHQAVFYEPIDRVHDALPRATPTKSVDSARTQSAFSAGEHFERHSVKTRNERTQRTTQIHATILADSQNSVLLPE